MSEVRIRPARTGDLSSVVRTLTTAFGEPLRADTWEWLQRSPEGEILVAEGDGVVVGTGSGLSFGATGWIGGVGVEPGSRGQGIARAVTEGISEWLRGAGARTLLLQATDLGRPVYDRLGFEAEGRYRMWSLPPARRRRRRGAPDGARPLEPHDFSAVLALDATATGERRDPAIRAAWSSGGVALADGPGNLQAYHLDSPWGAGPTVAMDVASGLALLESAQRPDAGVRVGVPEENGAAVRAMVRRGYDEVAPTLRMRAGEPVPWRPDLVFGVFNPFWG